MKRVLIAAYDADDSYMPPDSRKPTVIEFSVLRADAIDFSMQANQTIAFQANLL